VLPFKNYADSLVSFLDSVKAMGGGDLPEDVNGGLREVLKLEWASSTKCLIHFGDSPCHGVKFHNCKDDYPEGGLGDLDYGTIFTELKSLGIDYYFMEITRHTVKMTEEFSKIWKNSGVYLSNCGRLTDLCVKSLDSVSAKDFVVMIKETVAASMKKSLASGHKTLKGRMLTKGRRIDDIIMEDTMEEDCSR